MPLKDELDFFDLNDEMTYYEVEIWNNGECDDSKFFRTIGSAKSYLKKHAKSEYDCIKVHKALEICGCVTYTLYPHFGRNKQ